MNWISIVLLGDTTVIMAAIPAETRRYRDPLIGARQTRAALKANRIRTSSGGSRATVIWCDPGRATVLFIIRCSSAARSAGVSSRRQRRLQPSMQPRPTLVPTLRRSLRVAHYLHRDLHILCIGSRTDTNDAEKLPQDQERQGPHHHRSRSCQASITAAHEPRADVDAPLTVRRNAGALVHGTAGLPTAGVPRHAVAVRDPLPTPVTSGSLGSTPPTGAAEDHGCQPRRDSAALRRVPARGAGRGR
jgi:hypothetical protein